MNDRAELINGLYFTRSDVDARAVSAIGNRLTDLRLHPGAITLDASDCGVRCTVSDTDYAKGALILDAVHAPASLAPGSCFPTTEDARLFSRYTPNALAVVDSDGQRRLGLTAVERDGGAVSETPLAVREAKLGYFESIGQADQVQLEWACRLSAMDYRLRIGETSALLTQPKTQKPLIPIAV